MGARRDQRAPAILVAIAALVAAAVLFVVLRPAPALVGRDVQPSASLPASPLASPPSVSIAHDTCCAQTARFLRASWTSSEAIVRAELRLSPDPGFGCEVAIGADGMRGTLSCIGLLRGATSYVATLTLSTAAGVFPVEHAFKTMGDRLEGVKWFTEFEDPTGEPLACAAASCRIIQLYTTGADPLTAEGILRLGQQLNRSNDPGLDPAAIASVLTRLDARNRYHYYRLGTREEATQAAIYWLLRSGKPVVVISLAGQHAPLLIGYRGSFGTHYGDPANRWDQVVVQDPQRGDMRPETASRRPDKYRTPGFQTGQPLGLDEWYRDEWWLGFPYTSSLAGYGNIDRNDGVYPLPHWAGQFVIVVDDGDAANPPDREGRIAYR